MLIPLLSLNGLRNFTNLPGATSTVMGAFTTGTLEGTVEYGNVGTLVNTAATLVAGAYSLAQGANNAKAAEEGLTFSRIVPGGGLQASENAGGHLLLKHVGQTESQLLSRLNAEPGIRGASSFYDRAVAERAVSEALDANSSGLTTWLSGTKGRLTINYAAQSPVGISVPRGASSAVDVSGTRVILVRDPPLPAGYRIQTGFPTKP